MRILTNLALLLFSLSFLSCSGNLENKAKTNDSLNNAFMDAYKDKSLKEIREIFNSQSEQITGLLKISSLRLEITPGKNPANTGDEGVITKPLPPLASPAIIEKGMKEVAGNYYFEQHINSSGSIISTQLNERTKLPDFYEERSKNKTILSTKFNITKLYFHDRSDFKDKIPQASDNDPIAISSRKPIDSLDAQVKYTYVTKVEQIILDKDHLKESIGKGFIELKQLGSSSTTILVTGQTERLLSVVGMDAKGRLIDQNSSSSNSLPSPAKLKILEEFNEILTSTIKNIDAGKYKTTADLLSYVKPRLPIGLTTKEESEENTFLASYHFYQDVVKVVVYYAKDVKTVETNVTIKNEAVTSTGVALAEGDQEKEFGIIGADGNWIIKPTYKGLTSINPYYYKTCKDDTEALICNYFRLDLANKKLLSLSSQASTKGYALSKSLDSEHVIFYKDDQDPYGAGVALKGVLDKNGNIVLKPIYDLVFIAGNFIITTQENTKLKVEEFALHTISGKTVIAQRPLVIGLDGDFIFAQVNPNTGDQIEKYSLFDKNTGKSFLPTGAYALETNWNEDFLLVSTGKSKYFIDRKKTKKIDVSAYEMIKPFKDGYANVKNNKQFWGILNTKGKLVVPCAFEEISPVYNNLCLVKDTGPDQKQRSGLYNVSTGVMLVPLLAHEDSYSGINRSGPETIYLIGGKTYDAYGKEIKQ